MNNPNPFEYNDKPTPAMLINIDLFRRAFLRIHNEILLHVGESRERSIALTKLEEASMWINKAITHIKEGGYTGPHVSYEGREGE